MTLGDHRLQHSRPD